MNSGNAGTGTPPAALSRPPMITRVRPPTAAGAQTIVRATARLRDRTPSTVEPTVGRLPGIPRRWLCSRPTVGSTRGCCAADQRSALPVGCGVTRRGCGARVPDGPAAARLPPGSCRGCAGPGRWSAAARARASAALRPRDRARWRNRNRRRWRCFHDAAGVRSRRAGGRGSRRTTRRSRPARPPWHRWCRGRVTAAASGARSPGPVA